MKSIRYLPLAFALIIGCKESDPNFDFKSLKEVGFQPATISEGATVQILSFSGGPECTPEATYYYQYIGIVKGTRDTVRILSPCQQIPEGSRPEEGSFSAWEKTAAIIDEALWDHDEKSFESKNKLVVFNKHNPAWERQPYKTAIGTLSY
ncbi:MAG: hypothetical protein JWP88_836 [Flaviaesturariibacter sp.]|nr:hypothetical protein [Flaviaesturariibacter sp.]